MRAIRVKRTGGDLVLLRFDANRALPGISSWGNSVLMNVVLVLTAEWSNVYSSGV